MSHAYTPLDYLHGNGSKAYPVVDLTWALIAVAVIVIALITLFVCVAIFRRPGLKNTKPGEVLQVERPDRGLEWIWSGVSLTIIVLIASIIWTVKVLGDVNPPKVSSALTIEVTAHQWWWEFRYLNKDPKQIFTTEDELHIPVNTPVFFKLKSADVIHSFWIPALSGKTDVIPGMTNETWVEAHDAGTYYGQCTEYCGPLHAKMGFLTVAEPPAAFEDWRQQQIQPEAPAPASVSAGATAFSAHCSGCHTIRGTTSLGITGPDLTHLMTRMTLAAGALLNTPENRLQWIADPQSVKPGSLMPKPAATPQELADINAYLGSLK